MNKENESPVKETTDYYQVELNALLTIPARIKQSCILNQAKGQKSYSYDPKNLHENNEQDRIYILYYYPFVSHNHAL